MGKNVGGVDSVVRIVIGVIVALIGFFASIAAGWRVVAFVIAAILLFTGIYGF